MLPLPSAWPILMWRHVSAATLARPTWPAHMPSPPPLLCVQPDLAGKITGMLLEMDPAGRSGPRVLPLPLPAQLALPTPTAASARPARPAHPHCLCPPCPPCPPPLPQRTAPACALAAPSPRLQSCWCCWRTLLPSMPRSRRQWRCSRRTMPSPLGWRSARRRRLRPEAPAVPSGAHDSPDHDRACGALLLPGDPELPPTIPIWAPPPAGRRASWPGREEGEKPTENGKRNMCESAGDGGGVRPGPCAVCARAAPRPSPAPTPAVTGPPAARQPAGCWLIPQPAPLQTTHPPTHHLPPNHHHHPRGLCVELT